MLLLLQRKEKAERTAISVVQCGPHQILIMLIHTHSNMQTLEFQRIMQMLECNTASRLAKSMVKWISIYLKSVNESIKRYDMQ